MKNQAYSEIKKTLKAGCVRAGFVSVKSRCLFRRAGVTSLVEAERPFPYNIAYIMVGFKLRADQEWTGPMHHSDIHMRGERLLPEAEGDRLISIMSQQGALGEGDAEARAEMMRELSGILEGVLLPKVVSLTGVEALSEALLSGELVNAFILKGARTCLQPSHPGSD